MSTSDSEADPHRELAALAHALAGELERSRWLGTDGAPLPAARAPAPEVAPSAGAPGSVALHSGEPRPPRPNSFVDLPKSTAREKAKPSAAPASSAVLTAANLKAEEIRRSALEATSLEALRSKVAACTACGLCRTRKQTVFSDGSARVSVMFVGEAPGEHEDLQGLPFVGRAGQLLTDIITKGMGLSRSDVYIANVLKCRPPDNRDPSEAEKVMCTPWLDRQIELVDPKVIIPLGRHAAMHVLGVEASMSSLRGRVHALGSRKVVPTFHPAYLLRDTSKKKECWADIQLAMTELGIARTPPKSGA